MTTKTRQPQESAWASRGNEPNLGQKAAAMANKSKTQLSRMAKKRGRSAPSRFIAWSKQEQANIQQQLELMQSGKVLTGENHGSGWIDTTGNSIERAKARLVELESLLTEAGSAAISRPE